MLHVCVSCNVQHTRLMFEEEGVTMPATDLPYLHAKVAKVRAGTSLIFTFSLLGFGRVSFAYLLGITKDTMYLQQAPHHW